VLQRAGQLEVSLAVVGRFQADRTDVHRDELEGDCAAATHVVAALSVGAFEFSAGGDAKIGTGAGVNVGPVSKDVLGAESSAKRETLNQGGDQAACAKATGEDTAPPYGCGALLRVEVVRLLPARAAQVPTAAVEPAVPPP